ncbi:MAG: paraquat-inducible protein A [Acidobacteria bacterium]|nr:paraquat-inducible protein A [Acidobacteriota bacterium]
MTPGSRNLALAGVAVSVLVLIPGLFLPILTIQGRLNPTAVADLSRTLLDQGISESAVDSIRGMINPDVLPLLEASQGGLKGMLVSSIGKEITSSLAAGEPIEVYQQTRSIVSSVRNLYEVGSVLAATLIVFFSVIVPVTKSVLVCWAVCQGNALRRQRTLLFVEMIAKWSMADVFAVAVIIAFLAAQASQTVGAASALVSFRATFGPGFYWFTGYCLLSLAVQQLAARRLMQA